MAFHRPPISYVSGKYIYVVQTYDPGDEDADSPLNIKTGLETPPFIRIKRLRSSDGQVLGHYQQRAPSDVRFSGNLIQLVFKKEVQVLKFLSF